MDTTIDSIGLCLRCLADHPDQWALLKADPGMARAAFEEATRYDSSSQSLFRTTLEDFDFDTVPLQKHQKVLVLIGAAGRDPAKWTDPDKFDITRRVTASQMGYGRRHPQLCRPDDGSPPRRRSILSRPGTQGGAY